MAEDSYTRYVADWIDAEVAEPEQEEEIEFTLDDLNYLVKAGKKDKKLAAILGKLISTFPDIVVEF